MAGFWELLSALTGPRKSWPPQFEDSGGDKTEARRPHEAASELTEAMALYNTGVKLAKDNRTLEAVAAYDACLARFGHSPEAPVRKNVAWALYNKGMALAEMGQSEEALYNRGVLLGTLKRRSEEIEAYRRVVARFREDRETAVCEQVAKALVNAAAHGQEGQFAEAIAACDAVLAIARESPEPPLREQAERAALVRRMALNKQSQGSR